MKKFPDKIKQMGIRLLSLEYNRNRFEPKNDFEKMTPIIISVMKMMCEYFGFSNWKTVMAETVKKILIDTDIDGSEFRSIENQMKNPLIRMFHKV